MHTRLFLGVLHEGVAYNTRRHGIVARAWTRLASPDTSPREGRARRRGMRSPLLPLPRSC